MKVFTAFSTLLILGFVGRAYSQDGSIVAWGRNDSGQCNVPSPNTDFIAVSSGLYHSLGLKEDGSIVGWGGNGDGQCDVPAPNNGFIAIAAGGWHSLGLKEDSSIVAWGENEYGQCDVPSPNTGFIAIAAGQSHSLGLKEDGTILAWGWNGYGQCDVPDTGPFISVARGFYHSLGLMENGSIVAWGKTGGQCNVPLPNTDFIAIAGGGYHSLGLKEDGSIVAWGDPIMDQGQCDVPSPNTDFIAVDGGLMQSLGLKEDGSIVAWGHSAYGQCNVPEPNEAFVAVAGGGSFSVGLHFYLQFIEPNSSTTWTHFETDLPVSWEVVYSDYVDILLYRGAVLVETLAESAPNTGSWIFSGPVPMSWDPGDDYMIYIEDDLSHSAWSGEFTIAPSEGAEVIAVTEPDGSTTWDNIEMDRMISWNYPALIGQAVPLSGESVSITIYKNGFFVDSLISSIPNTGTWVFCDSLPESWETGSDYSLHVVDNLANHGWSEDFSLEADVGINVHDYLAFGLDRPFLFPISPNPSEGFFTVSYFIPQASEVSVTIYDIAGKLVFEANGGENDSGIHQLQTGGIPSGVYFCRLRVGSDSLTEKFVMIR